MSEDVTNGEDGDEDNNEGAEGGDDDNDIGILADMLESLDDFVLEPAPQGSIVKCRITRDRKGMDRGK